MGNKQSSKSENDNEEKKKQKNEKRKNKNVKQQRTQSLEKENNNEEEGAYENMHNNDNGKDFDNPTYENVNSDDMVKRPVPKPKPKPGGMNYIDLQFNEDKSRMTFNNPNKDQQVTYADIDFNK